MPPRHSGRLALPPSPTVRAPGVSRRTGAPRSVEPLPASRIVVLDAEGNPVDSTPQDTALESDAHTHTHSSTASVPSPPAPLPLGYTTALLRGGFAVVCGVCAVGLPKYTCPKCSSPLCSLSCYRSPAHGDGCAERFYEGEVRAAMGTVRAGQGERDAVLRVLARADAAAAARGEQRYVHLVLLF